ncbi:MAG: TA system VapC family ribonuclease toxin [Oceanipulchritudo sp.]
MSGVIDTNILLYAVNTECVEHGEAREFLESARSRAESHYLTEGICYEFLRVTTHPKVFPMPLQAADALGFMDVLLESPGIQLLALGETHWRRLREILAGLHHPCGNLFCDLRTAALMRENGVRTIYTADADFLQMPDIEVVNPLKQA